MCSLLLALFGKKKSCGGRYDISRLEWREDCFLSVNLLSVLPLSLLH